MSISECNLQVKCLRIPPIQNISTTPNIKLLFSSNRQLQVTRMFAWQNRYAIQLQKKLFGGTWFVKLCYFVIFPSFVLEDDLIVLADAGLHEWSYI